MRFLAPLIAAAVLASCTGSQQKAAFDNTVVAGSVKAKLIGIDADAAGAVKVTAANGAVTLLGQARDRDEAARYVAAARTVDGVTSVSDSLRINPRLRGVREGAADLALTGRVSAAIAAQAGINVLNLNVSSNAGVVSIGGDVPSASVARTVTDTARTVSGVRRVISQISVRK